MSETALRDLNSLPSSERKNESSSKGSLGAPCVGSANENLNVILAPANVNGNDSMATGAETGISEFEYIDSGYLIDVEDVDRSLEV